jgi:hypothetical protein
LEVEKLGKDIELKDIIIKKKRNESIDVDRHVMIMGARISALRQFLEDSFVANAHEFYPGSALDPEKLRGMAKEFIKQTMDAYLSGSRSIDVQIIKEGGQDGGAVENGAVGDRISGAVDNAAEAHRGKGRGRKGI